MYILLSKVICIFCQPTDILRTKSQLKLLVNTVFLSVFLFLRIMCFEMYFLSWCLSGSALRRSKGLFLRGKSEAEVIYISTDSFHYHSWTLPRLLYLRDEWHTFICACVHLHVL